jgi:hypothetical protein
MSDDTMQQIQPYNMNDYTNSKGMGTGTGTGTESGAMLGMIFLVLSLILSIIFSIATLIRGQGQDSSKMIILCSWVIFGSLFSYIIIKNNNTNVNFVISSFVIMISCMLTCRQINVIQTCIV